MTTAAARPATIEEWYAANRRYLETEILRLRLLLRRRVLWLRRQWKHDPLQSFQGMVISETQADALLAGEDRRAEERFYREDAEAGRLSRELEALHAELGALSSSVAAAGGSPALDILTQFFHLNAFERAVLLLCLALELDPGFERLYAYVQDDVTRKHPTEHLAWTLFADPETARRSFLPEAPLRRFRLIVLEPGGAAGQGSQAFRLDRRIGDYLLGLNRLDGQAAQALRPLKSTPLLAPAQEEAVRRLEGLLRAWNNGGHMPAINLVGPPGVGRRVVARALATRLGIGIYSLDTGRIPAAPPERQELLRLLEREALLLPCAYYLDLSETDRTQRADTAAVSEFLEDLRSLRVVASRDPWRSDAETIVVRVPKADASDQHGLWRTALGDSELNSNGRPDSLLRQISQQFDFGPQAIHQAAAAGRGLARLRDPESGQVAPEDLWQACREQAAQAMEGLAQRLEPCHTWDDIVLPDDALLQLRELAGQVAHRGQVYDAWGFGARLSRGRGIAALFSGPSGTGKTMAAEILAAHLALDLYRIDLAGVVSKYVGETEKNLRRVFDAAEQSGAILFFDEADALFGKRSEVKDSHDRYANIEINYLLQRMEDYRGLAILATNMKSQLDQAFLRRLRFLIEFPFPDAAHRLRIWQKIFPRQAEVEALDHASLGRLEIPGGNIRNIAVNAAFLAAETGTPIRMEHVLRAARREYAKIEKLMLESEFGSYYDMVKP